MNNTLKVRPALATAVICVMSVCTPAAWSQQKSESLQQRVAGTSWILVSADMIDPQGNKRPLVMGSDVKGRLSFDRSGLYSYQVIAAIPKVAKDRIATTPQEDKLISQGVLSSFGTYKVDEGKQTVTLTAERSTYPNQNGVPTVRKLVVENGQLVLENTGRLAGGQTRVVWKQAP